MVRKKITRLLKSATVISMACLSVTGAYAYQGNGGNTSTGCNTSNNIYSYQYSYGACEYSGFGWIYFEYSPGFNGTIDFVPTSGNSGGSLSISNQCVQYGGFWHYGYFQYKQTNFSGDSGTSVKYYGFGSTGNPKHGQAGSTSNLDKNLSLVNTNIHRSQVFSVNGKEAAYSVRAASNSTVEGYYRQYINTTGDDNRWGGALNYFCWGEGMTATTFNGKISSAKFSDEITNGAGLSLNATRNVVGNTAYVSFTNQMKRNNDGKDGGVNGSWSTDQTSGSQSFSKNSGWKNVKITSKSVNIPPGGTRYLYQDFTYSSKVDGNGTVQSWANAPQSCNISGYKASGRWCVKLTRNRATASGTVDAQVTTDSGTYTNPGNVIMSTNGSYTIKFQHTIKRGNDGAGGTVGFGYSTAISGSSNRYANLPSGKGSTHSGTSASIAEGKSTVVVSYNTETITGYLYPEETRTFCQNLSYKNVVSEGADSWGKTSNRCVKVQRAKATCPIDNSSFGVDSGSNTAKMTLRNASNSQTVSRQGDGTISVWAKPKDLIRYSYEACASGQLSEDYYSFGRNQGSAYVFRGDNTTSSTPNKYLFGTQLGSGTQPYTYIIGGNSAYSDNQYNKTFVSPSVNGSTFACANSTTNQYYQIPDHNSLNCRTKDYVGRNSDAGSIISQTLTYPRKPNSGNNTLVGQVKIPYNYDLGTTPLTTNPKNVPVNAGTAFDIGFKVDVTPRCNVQVQGICNSTDKEYKTFPKTTQYRIYSWAVNSSTSETQLKQNIGTEIKDKSGNVIGYYLSNDPAKLGYTINKSGSDLFGTDGNTVIVTTSDGTKISVPANTAIGTKICAAVAVWPADSHDLPGSGTINDSSQSVALKNSSNLRQWRSSKPSCYTVGKKPSISVKNGGAYAKNGIETTTTYRMVGSTNYLFGSWAEYSAMSAKQIIGFSTGAGLWGGAKNGNVAGKECRYSSMTLANSDCSRKNLGNIRLGNTASSPKQILGQIITRYTSTGTPDLGNANVNIQGACIYDVRAGTYIKQSSSSDSNYTCLHNGSAYAYSSGTLTINPGTLGPNSYASWLIPYSVDNYSSRTYVIHAKDIIVNESIIYGSAAYEKNPVGHSMTIFNSVASVPQVILIADNSIQIGASTVNLDAWLIAPEINTCSHDEYGHKFSTAVGSGKYNIDSRTCNRQLVINGPVFTKKLKLNRTHGGGGDTKYISRSSAGLSVTNYDNNSKFGAASPAETFNISPEVYLWSFHQATRFSQATTTYQRELPTRY